MMPTVNTADWLKPSSFVAWTANGIITSLLAVSKIRNVSGSADTTRQSHNAFDGVAAVRTGRSEMAKPAACIVHLHEIRFAHKTYGASQNHRGSQANESLGKPVRTAWIQIRTRRDVRADSAEGRTGRTTRPKRKWRSRPTCRQ